MERLKKDDMAQRKIQIVFVDVNEFYDENDKLNTERLRFRVKEINPSLVLISICFSETLDIRFALEILGIFPELRLKRGLQLATKGKQIKLDPTQVELLETMAGPCNIEKTTVLHGPEGSGKSLLAMEVLKMKLIHYMKKLAIGTGTKKQVKVWICGACNGEDRVPYLLRQFISETADIKDHCVLKIQPIKDLKISSPKAFQKSMKTMLYEDGKSYPMTIVLIDEVFPDFTTKKWKDFQGINHTDFVIALRHAFNDGQCLKWHHKLWRKEVQQYEEYMAQEGIQKFDKTIFCHLRISHRCTEELISLMYYLMIHSPPKEKLFKEKSFFHMPNGLPGHKPIWLEVPSVNTFIQYTNSNQMLKEASNVMVIYDADNVKDVIQTLRGHCLARNWTVCPSKSIMGSEASIVIIYDMKSINFEAISRAVIQLIFVTTKKSR